MILTALRMRKERMTFASVHDSYWTHAKDIDKMSAIIRDTFIELHSQDILGTLRAEVSSFVSYNCSMADILFFILDPKAIRRSLHRALFPELLRQEDHCCHY
jgi:hypothetical protein